MIKKILIPLHIFFITCVCFSQTDSLSAIDILDAYQQTMEKSLFHIGKTAYKEECKIEDKNIYNTSDGYKIEVSTAIRKTTFLHDSNRIDCRHEYETYEFNQNPTVRKSQYLLDDEHYFQVSHSLNEPPPYISLFTKNLRRYAHASLGTTGNAFEGYMEGDSETPIWKVLKEERDLKLRDEMEDIDGHKTYVIEAQTNHGLYTLWVDPESGFNLRRCIVHRKDDELVEVKRIKRPSNPEMVEHIFSLDSVKVNNFDGLLLPVEGIITIKKKYSDGREHYKKLVYKRYDIDMDPDFSKFENAFDFISDIPNGTPVLNMDASGGNFEQMWQDGKVIPIDIQPESLLGKPLPELKDFGIELIKINKKVLLCFFDIEQRPSRNCITQLNKRIQELKEKEIAIVIVHASKIEKEKLNEWIKENDISLTVGMIQDDEDKARENWGIQSLPWLILTDKNHIVIDEGFSIDDLNGKIKDMN